MALIPALVTRPLPALMVLAYVHIIARGLAVLVHSPERAAWSEGSVFPQANRSLQGIAQMSPGDAIHVERPYKGVTHADMLDEPLDRWPVL